MNDEPPGAFPARLPDSDRRAQALRHLLFEPGHVAIGPGRGRAARGPVDAATRLSTSRTESPFATASRASSICASGGSASSARRMSHVELAVAQQLLDGRRELEQPQRVGDGGARASQRLGGFGVRHAELVDQAFQAGRFLEGIQVLALDVLDQRDGERVPVGHVAHQRRHGSRARPGAPPASAARPR